MSLRRRPAGRPLAGAGVAQRRSIIEPGQYGIQQGIAYGLAVQAVEQGGAEVLQLGRGAAALVAIIHVHRYAGGLGQGQIARCVFGQEVEFGMKFSHNINDLSVFEVSD